MKQLIMVLLSSCVVTFVQANPDVISREYKLMLDPENFSYVSELSDVNDFIQVLQSAVEDAIDRDVSGTVYLAKDRTVKFYDTASCTLKEMGYSFRERIEDGDSEVTLKFRSPDRYIADFEDVEADSSSAETKLESDITSSSEADFRVVYSHSSKVSNSRTINEMADINDQFDGFNDDYGLSDSLALAQVGDLSISEHVYRGMTIDLGQYDAEISVTLWYDSAPSGSDIPVIAEVSFKYEDSGADYTRKVVNRAKSAFSALEELTDWISSDSQTKTQYVYDYDSDFCSD